MNRRQKKLLETINTNPISGNIRWLDIEFLFVSLGAEIVEGKGSKIAVVLNNQVAVFHRPHPRKEADKGAVKATRDFLKQTGVV